MSDAANSEAPMSSSITKGREPATDFDTAEVQRRLRRMPFAGEIMAPHVRAIEQDPLPPINEKGFRDCEGWVAVYEAVVQESACDVWSGCEYRRRREGCADTNRLDQRNGRAARRRSGVARRHVSLAADRG